MRIIKKLPPALLIMTAFVAGWSTIAASHEHHPTYSAGEPGEQIKFVVRNIGTEDHEFILASTQDNLKHAAAMRKHPGMAHDEPNGLRLARKQSGEIVWKFTTAGTFEYSCLIADHRKYGMTGRVVVK